MVDFLQIHAFDKGKHDSFEELVCQLASHEDFPKDSKYLRVDGSGGDGGVEAYWVKPNGKKTGYQAKYFRSSAEIKWKQIDNSVEQALTTHPELECYIIALPCDLTDLTGQKKRKGSKQYWDEHEFKWQLLAQKKGIKFIKFELWTKSTLISLMLKPKSVGLNTYFFGKTELTMNWFQKKIGRSVNAIGERYNPKDHVDIKAEKLFSLIARTPSFKEDVCIVIEDMKNSFPINIVSQLKKKPSQKLLNNIKKAFLDVDYIIDQINSNIQNEWNVDHWLIIIDKILNLNNDIIIWIFEEKRKHANNFNVEIDVIILLQINSNSFKIKLEKIKSIFSPKHILAEKSQFAFISGTAGSGKTHLLARCAENALSFNQPVILLLGQNIGNSDLFTQINNSLDIQGLSHEEFFGALNAAGKVAGLRTLLLIDAINEGVGCQYWYDNIANLIYELKFFSQISCVVSCRSEYIKHSVPEKILHESPNFVIKGFETPEEQLAASIIYLDKRGIARPSTPWLSPEFINPLFLRTVCQALKHDNKSEFPVGLYGTSKIFDFYIEAISTVIKRKENSAVSIYHQLINTLDGIAGVLIANREDFIEIDQCRELILCIFKNMNVSTAPDWLSVFLNEGLLRTDILPQVNGEISIREVIRFSFQRFQDFKMAEKVLLSINSTNGLFDTDGAFSFCIYNNDIFPKWNGLIHAIGVILPEKFSKELIDILPGGFNKWSNNDSVFDVFIESVRWRNHNAFKPTTIKLFNKYNKEHEKRKLFSVFLQISVSVNHPWNANFLHSKLMKRKLSDRDAFWSIHFNYQWDSIETSTNTLIDWSLNGQEVHTNPKNQFLAALTLCWFFTSSNRYLRDKSTKALTNLFINNFEIFPVLLIKFAKIDDLYVLERLLAGAYGSCCLNSDAKRLRVYSGVVFEHIFKSGSPPYGLLLRDYALGIIELAHYHLSLPNNVNLAICKPPYNSPNIRFTTSKEKLEHIVEKAGDPLIFNSVTGLLYDFSIYIISPLVRKFLDNGSFATLISSKKNIKKLDINLIKRWIAKRAYDYGWSKEIFSSDSDYFHQDLRRHRNNIERIGKKYQWLALNELLCRFADNYLINSHADNSLKLYSGSNDISFIRDIDPTILTSELKMQCTDLKKNVWVFDPLIIHEKISQRELIDWPSLLFVNNQLCNLPFRYNSMDNQKWLVLDENQSLTEKYPVSKSLNTSHDSRMLEFRHVTTIFINLLDAENIVNFMTEKQEINIQDVMPSQVCGEGFLYEALWRNTWNQSKFTSDSWNFPDGVNYVSPAKRYSWESYLDASFPEGGWCYVPSQWLAKTLELKPDITNFGQWNDKFGEVIFRQIKCNANNIEDQYSICLLRYDKAEELLKNENLTYMTFIVNERDSWLTRGSSEAKFKRVESLSWKDNNCIKTKIVRDS